MRFVTNEREALDCVFYFSGTKTPNLKSQISNLSLLDLVLLGPGPGRRTE